jgi:hypothetical protein
MMVNLEHPKGCSSKKPLNQKAAEKKEPSMCFTMVSVAKITPGQQKWQDNRC